MTREELIAWATRNGWKLDRWGHLKKEFSNGTHRLKLSRIAVRHELATPFGCYAEFGIATAMPSSGLCRMR
jgi:hypothetical protein